MQGYHSDKMKSGMRVHRETAFATQNIKRRLNGSIKPPELSLSLLRSEPQLSENPAV